MYAAFLFLILAAVACTCGPLQQAQETASTAAAAATSINEAGGTIQAAATEFGPTVQAAMTNAPTFEAQMTALVETANASGVNPADAFATATAFAGGGQGGGQGSGSPNGQWAASATASSQFSPDTWSAQQAVGAPNTQTCGDIASAWASGTSSEIATLTLTYANPVVPTQINIYETNLPDKVTLVEVIDASGVATEVYTGVATPLADGTYPCPYILTIDVTGVSTPITQVRVTIDQTVHTGYNEIDAVELVGTP